MKLYLQLILPSSLNQKYFIILNYIFAVLYCIEVMTILLLKTILHGIITLHYISHYIALHITLHYILHYITYYITLHITLHYKLHCSTYYISLHIILHHISNYITLHITLHYILAINQEQEQSTVSNELHCDMSYLSVLN